MRKWVSLVAAVATAVGGLAATAAPANGDSTTHVIPESHASWATPSARAASTSSSERITFRVYLNLADEAGAERTAQAVSTPGSASYRHFLTSEQVNAQFAPTSAAVAAVKSWLSRAGATVGAVPSNNQYVEATASAATVSKIFAVHLGQYRVRDRVLRATDGDLHVPASLANLVTGVVGVDQSLALIRPLHTNGQTRAGAAPNNGGTVTATAMPTASPNAKPSVAPPPDGFRNSGPCSAYWAQKVATVPSFAPYGSRIPYAPCGYVPSQLRSVYGVKNVVGGGNDGRGVTVAIVDAFASPTIFTDAIEYSRRNDPGHVLQYSQLSQIVFPDNAALEDACDASGWYGEETLDVEAVHAMAPGAKILYVGASDCNDTTMDVALNTIVANNLADIVSNSYGDIGEDVPQAEVRVFEHIAVEAAVKGIGLYFSSGDDGDETDNLAQPSPDFSASSPFVTAVGGTSLGVASDGNRAIETGWQTRKSTLTNGTWSPVPPAYLYGAGGGTSRLFAQPWYQQGVVPNALASQNQKGKHLGRVVPDVALVGDPNTGMLIGETQTFPDGTYYDQYRIGGTSLSCPLFAGIMALANQRAGGRLGFANPLLYEQYGTRAFNDVVHRSAADIRVDYANGVDAADGRLTSIRTFDFQGLTIKTAPGYDNVTGMGTPNGATFLTAITK